MGKGLSTAGMLVKWAVESTAGTRPTTGYTVVEGVYSLPAFGNDVNAIDVTPLSATKNKVYTKGLADNGGTYALSIYDHEDAKDSWDAVMTAYAALTGGKQMWFEIAFPTGSGLDSFYIPAEPIERGFGGAEVDSALENTLNIMPTGDYVEASASS